MSHFPNLVLKFLWQFGWRSHPPNPVLPHLASTSVVGLVLGCITDGGHGVGGAQEIPASFTAETGWPGEENCALVTSISTIREWPLQFRRLHDLRKGIVKAVSVGDGWAQFIADQNLGPGAFLTFEIVDSRRLVVALHHRSAPEDFGQPHLADMDTKLVRDRDISDAGDNGRRHSLQVYQVRIDDRPNFIKTLRKSHMLKQDSAQIVSANPRPYDAMLLILAF